MTQNFQGVKLLTENYFIGIIFYMDIDKRILFFSSGPKSSLYEHWMNMENKYKENDRWRRFVWMDEDLDFVGYDTNNLPEIGSLFVEDYNDYEASDMSQEEFETMLKESSWSILLQNNYDFTENETKLVIAATKQFDVDFEQIYKISDAIAKVDGCGRKIYHIAEALQYKTIDDMKKVLLQAPAEVYPFEETPLSAPTMAQQERIENILRELKK